MITARRERAHNNYTLGFHAEVSGRLKQEQRRYSQVINLVFRALVLGQEAFGNF